MRTSPRSRRALATLALALALIAFPLGALASHDFGDVPDSNPFHADISALVASGVTSGCGGGNYCPSANVTREQMAAFLNRLGALAPGKTPVVNATKLDGLDSSQLLRSDVVATGHSSCPGSAMQPAGSGYTYYTINESLYLGSVSGTFTCALWLPDGATITAFRVGAYDNDADDYVECTLYRSLLFGVPGGYEMAFVTGDSLATPGAETLEDLTIGNAIVDTAVNTYYAACYISGPDSNIVLVSASVEFTVEGLPLP